MKKVPAEDRVVHLKQRDKIPSETFCGQLMYTLGPEHSAVEHEEGAQITCFDCLERYIR